jgi:polyisoprenyl-teichoic acid--peptidoglycan teichoic acid transferase
MCLGNALSYEIYRKRCLKLIKRKKVVVSILVACILAIVAYGSYYAYSIYSFSKNISTATGNPQDQVTELTKGAGNKDNINILVVGIDAGKFTDNSYRSDTGRTDTIMVFSINQKTNQVSLISIPRDTYVNIPGRGMDKINAAYAYGGSDLSIKTISQFLGIPINHYARVNYDTFTKVVDGLGGVTVNVTEDVRAYEDNQVKVPKGVQKLDGKNAFLYVQIREGDIERVQRQQKFVKALSDQAISLSGFAKLPRILNSTSSSIKTDMSPQEMLDLAMKMRSMNPGNMKNEIIPGKAAMLNGISYWFADENASKEIVNRLAKQ